MQEYLPIISLIVLALVVAEGILMTTFAMYLAFEMDINPMATSLYAKLGANAGCASTLSITGILAAQLSNPMGDSCIYLRSWCARECN